MKEPATRRPRCPSTEGMLELDTLDKPCGNPTAAAESGAAPAINEKNPMRHHGYSHESSYDDGDDSDDSDRDDAGFSYSHGEQHAQDCTNQNSPMRTTYLLGQTIQTPLLATPSEFIPFNPSMSSIPTMTTTTATSMSYSFNNYNNALPKSIRRFQKELYWLTYRNDLVVPLRPVNLKTDAGWGCMLRSAQMMMAQAARCHFARSWDERRQFQSRGEMEREEIIMSGVKSNKPCGDIASNNAGANTIYGKGREMKQSLQLEPFEEQDANEVERIATWFADFPNHADSNEENSANGGNSSNDDHGSNSNYNNSSSSSSSSSHTKNKNGTITNYGDGGLSYHWYSLHQMVAAGLGLGVLPGEWYGPMTACHVLKELNEIHVASRERLLLCSNESARRDLSDYAENNDNKAEDEREEGKGKKEQRHSCKVDMFRVHIATEGCIYVDAVNQLMTRNFSDEAKESLSEEGNDSGEADVTIMNDPTSSSCKSSEKEEVIDDPLRMFRSPDTTKPATNTSSTPNKQDDFPIDPSIEWDTSLLLLLPLRLGLQSIPTQAYGSTLAKLLSLSQSVGMLGGTPRHALWFYGADDVSPTTEECGGWYGLDPHVTQLAPRGTRVLISQTSLSCGDNGHQLSATECNNDNYDNTDANNNSNQETNPKYQWQVQLTESYLRSLHTSPTTNTHSNHDKPIPLSKLDPSCALGFYFRDYPDFCNFRRALASLTKEHCRPNKLPEIVTVMETTPNYDADVSAAMKDMMLSGKGKTGVSVDYDGLHGVLDDLDAFSIKSDEGEGDHLMSDQEDDDDDDYVLL